MLVLYTPAAMAGAGGQAKIEAWIGLEVFEAEQSFELSDALPRLNLVETKVIPYSETGSNFNSLTRLTRPSDGSWMKRIPGAMTTMLTSSC